MTLFNQAKYTLALGTTNHDAAHSDLTVGKRLTFNPMAAIINAK
jgi:hypothetical protein